MDLGGKRMDDTYDVELAFLTQYLSKILEGHKGSRQFQALLSATVTSCLNMQDRRRSLHDFIQALNHLYEKENWDQIEKEYEKAIEEEENE
jgi:hypothetical protein